MAKFFKSSIGNLKLYHSQEILQKKEKEKRKALSRRRKVPLDDLDVDFTEHKRSKKKNFYKSQGMSHHTTNECTNF